MLNNRWFLLMFAVSLLAFFFPAAASAASFSVKPAVVKKVVDAYTFEIVSGKKTEQVRLLNVLPLSDQKPQALSSFEALAVAEDVRQLIGKTVYLELDNQARDEQNRLLAYVWLKKPKTGSVEEMVAQMLNAKMILLGYAEWNPVNPNYKYTGELLAMETDAYFANRGVWGK